MRGDPLAVAWWSEDGVRFEQAPIDGCAVGLGGAPVIDRINDHHWASQVTANGLALFRRDGRLVSATVGARVVFEPLAYRSPAEFKFKLEDLTNDEEGRWWAAGHASNDSMIGQIFWSRDGSTWQQVPAKIEGSVLQLIRFGGKLQALHYKHTSTVTEGSLIKFASFRDHVFNVILAPTCTIGVGAGFVGVLPLGGKRARYVAPPTGGKFQIAAFPGGGFLLGGGNGLWSSPDAIAWQAIPTVTGAVTAIVPSASGLTVVTARSEVYVVRES